MLFNIINPSDPYTMRAVDLEIAAVAVCMIGSGEYALEEIGGDRSGHVPMFLFGGLDEWFTKQFGRGFNATVEVVVSKRADELIKALASVHIGTPANKAAFDEQAAQCTDEDAYSDLLHKLHDEKRSSMNDIGRRAWHLARSVVETKLLQAECAAEAATATIQ